MATETPLNKLKLGQEGKIIALKGSGQIHKRLLDMGLVKGSIVRVKRIAPLGDPIEIKVKGYNLSLRKEEALSILVRVIE